MKYIDVKTKKVVWIHEIRLANPNMSIPDNADLNELGYVLIENTEPPVKDGFYAVEVDPIDGKQTWELKPVVIYVPNVVNPKQFRLALLELELLDDLENYLANIENQEVKRKLNIDFEFSPEFYRDGEFLIAVTQALNLDSTKVDEIFTIASNIR